MKKQKKRKQKKKKNSKSSSVNYSKSNIQVASVFPLEILAEKRSGGAESIKGFVFQCQYAAWKILKHLDPSRALENKSIRLEGLEDIDVFNVSTDKNDSEFIQVKSSKNRMDAGTFWGKHRILQNFAEVYINNPKSRFRLVHDMPFSEGHLSALNQFSTNGNPLSKKDLKYWSDKFLEFRKKQETSDKKNVWDWKLFDLSEFFKRVVFEHISETDLSDEICRSLIHNFEIAEGNEGQYMKAFCWHVLLWSRSRAIVRHKDVIEIIESVKEDIARGPSNPVIQKNWMTRISFDPSEKESHYFEGKPARPHDIVAGLPAKRLKWEKEIFDAFNKSDVTVIRASSGQGKSTLAWITTFQLAKKSWHPYELKWCADAGEIGNFLSFIESRIKIGEAPLIIIDGLNHLVSEWGELAKRTIDLPVKYIVTSREEDWYRFGADHSQLSLIPVSIDMDMEEAGNIFRQFKVAGKLQSNGLRWQTAWEQVQKRKVLIEYVYLLTQGAMMKDRLSHQIKTIASEKNRAEKLEILRMISVADLCGVQLPSLALIESVNKRVGFQSDRGETLKSLEREYQILIKDQLYAEGLHLIRSRHLSDILHEALPMAETLISLLVVIEPESLYEFCTHALQLIEGRQKTFFLNKLSEHIAGKTFADMVRVIDGLFTNDAKQNWEINRKPYDDMFSKGALDKLFILGAFQWGGSEVLQIASKIEKFKEGLKPLLDVINGMIHFDPETSDTYTFLNLLSHHMAPQKFIYELKGVGRLVKWYSQFDLKCPFLEFVDENLLWRAINSLDPAEAGELIDAYYSVYPEEYKTFFEKNKAKIVGRLKRLTNTLTIEENAENLLIEYLTYSDDEVSNLNEESMKRARLISSFCPHYNEYHVNGVYPPIPGSAFYLDMIDESKKRMSKKAIGNKFISRINRIWSNSIMVNYESASVYEWQKQWYDIRVKSLDLAGICTRFIESILEGKNIKANKMANELDKIRPVVLNHLSIAKEFPSKEAELFQAGELKDTFKMFSEWFFSWNNFLKQLLWLLNKNDREKNVVNVNIQETRRNLGNMQDAYKKVMERTFKYFDVKELIRKEEIEYNRLAKTVDFYLLNLNRIGKISNVRIAAATLWKKQEKSRIYKVQKILVEFEERTGIEIVHPIQTIDNNGIIEVAIGFRITAEELFGQRSLLIIIGLLELSDVSIDYFHFVTIEGCCTENSNAIRFHRDFFKEVKKSMESGNKSIDFGLSRPFSIPIQKEVLDTLPGISLGKVAEENIVMKSSAKILIQLWRLSEIRNRLSIKEKTEISWQQELEQECEQILKEKMRIMKKEPVEDVVKKFRELIDDVVMKQKEFTPDDFQRFYIEDVMDS